MDNNKRSSHRIKNKFIVYAKAINQQEFDMFKDEIYHTIDPSDSFGFFMSLNNLDSSYGDLNKAFVLMMKEMDAKLNYIIDILRDKEYQHQLKIYTKTYSCDLSRDGVSFILEERLSIGDLVFVKFALPIANHYEIKALGTITRKTEKDNKYCYGLLFNEIKQIDVELIIHYMLFFERKMLKSRNIDD